MSLQTIPLSEAELLEEIERIRAHYPATQPLGKTDPERLERFSGLFADDPLFEAAVRAGQEWRKADQPNSETEASLENAHSRNVRQEIRAHSMNRRTDEVSENEAVPPVRTP